MMRARTIAITLGTLMSPALAFAQAVNNTGFALDRFEPSDRGSDWFGVESLSYSGTKTPAVGVVLDYANQPLVLRNNAGEEVTNIVRDQLFAHLGGSLTLLDRLNLGLNLPIAVINLGGSGTLNGVRYSLDEGAQLGDLRLGANYRLFGEARSPLRAALGLQLHLPTGSRSAFTGDGGVRVMPAVHVAGDVDQFAYAAGLGWRLHGQQDNFAGEPFGSDLELRVSAGVRVLERKLLLGPEFYASSVVSDSGDGFFAKRTTPVELLLGAHYDVDGSWRFGAGVGPGLTQGLGSPEVRGVLSLEWRASAESSPGDRDHDGIADGQDACPEQAGPVNPDPKLHGCPIADRDKDGIADDVDACPDQAGASNPDSKLHGCPAGDRDRDGVVDSADACPDLAGAANSDPKLNGCPPDRDRDGILDSVDACPDVAGPASTDASRNGCPDADDDGDGILNSADACPRERGVKSTDFAKNGCPLAKIDAGTGQITILEQVQFATGSAELLPASDSVLGAVQKILTGHPEITKVAIEGHTDNRGARELNRVLSRERAYSVLRWLTTHGIQSVRLSAAGFGPDRPIADNETDAGRQINRRVEFHIVQRGAEPTGAVAPKK